MVYQAGTEEKDADSTETANKSNEYLSLISVHLLDILTHNSAC